MITVRRAIPEDAVVLTGINLSTWTTRTCANPLPLRYSDYHFFDDGTRLEDVLVAEIGYLHCGFIKFRSQAGGLSTRAHVLDIAGLAVDPPHQRMGVGRRLVEAAVAEAESRGMLKLAVRVVGTNELARSLFERCGFAIDAMLRDEYFVDGRFVDDVLMSRRIDGRMAAIA